MSNNLGGNEKNMIHLSEALKINTTIEKLNLRHNDLGDNEKNTIYLSVTLKINTSIKVLWLTENNIGEPIKKDFLQKFVNKKIIFEDMY